MEDLQSIFNQLKEVLAAYDPPFESRNNLPGNFGLYSKKEVTAFGRKYSEMFFAGLIIQKSYVGFYFMPVYTNPQLKASLDPALLKMLKGKSCFYIKKVSPEVVENIRQALEVGFACFQDQGWV